MAIVQKFEIHQVRDRAITEQVYRKVPVEGSKDGKTQLVMETIERIVPVSYMVYFPNGGSTWFETKGAMAEAGILEHENIEIDTETGLPVAPPQHKSLRDQVQAGVRSRAVPKGGQLKEVLANA
jgi:hypothetical protein